MSDALERLRNRPRPTVPARDASLISATPAPPSTISFDIPTSRYPDSETSALPDAQIHALPPQAAKPQESPPLQTKQTTLRFEQGVSERLQNLCRENGIPREVLIEALFEYGESHPEVLEVMLAQARLKNEQRQQIANYKRAQSMIQKFGSAVG